MMIQIILIASFIVTAILPVQVTFGENLLLPKPGVMLHLSPAVNPLLMKGLKIHPDNPFKFDFIIDRGQFKQMDSQIKQETNKLIKYFLTAMTVPEKDLWVNLSPYEKNRMIADNLGQTTMGRDMLAQDYILKQLTASLVYPEEGLGKKFWDRVYAKAQEEYGQTVKIPVNMFNKVWIVADRADVYEHQDVAFIASAHLKVMLEEDYVAMSAVGPAAAAAKQSPQGAPHLSSAKSGLRANKDTASASPTALTSQIIREIIFPELEKEINTGTHFAPLRQMFYSMILAAWYKIALKESLLSKVYGNKSKVGVGVSAAGGSASGGNQLLTNEQIYQQYLKAYKKGVFNFIKDSDTAGQEKLPRKYFSGGLNVFQGDAAHIIKRQAAISDKAMAGNFLNVVADFSVLDAAMASNKQDTKILILGEQRDEIFRLRKDGFLEKNIEVIENPQQALARLQEDPGIQMIITTEKDFFKMLKIDAKEKQRDSTAKALALEQLQRRQLVIKAGSKAEDLLKELKARGFKELQYQLISGVKMSTEEDPLIVAVNELITADAAMATVLSDDAIELRRKFTANELFLNQKIFDRRLKEGQRIKINYFLGRKDGAAIEVEYVVVSYRPEIGGKQIELIAYPANVATTERRNEAFVIKSSSNVTEIRDSKYVIEIEVLDKPSSDANPVNLLNEMKEALAGVRNGQRLTLNIKIGDDFASHHPEFLKGSNEQLVVTVISDFNPEDPHLMVRFGDHDYVLNLIPEEGASSIQSVGDPAMIEKNGGIDLKSTPINRIREGSGVAITLDAAQLARLDVGNFDGIIFDIASIEPIVNIKKTLGLAP